MNKLKDKFFVFSMTKMATTHVQHILHNIFPEKRIASFDRVYVPTAYSEWTGETSFERLDPPEKFCWATRMIINDESVWDIADVFIDSGKRELAFGETFLHSVDKQQAFVLNRNLRDWMYSEVEYFNVSTDPEYIYQIFFNKQQFYKRLVNRGFKIINVSTSDVTEEIIKFFDIKKPTQILKDYVGVRVHNVIPEKTQITIDIVDKLFENLNITPEEENLPYIPRLS